MWSAPTCPSIVLLCYAPSFSTLQPYWPFPFHLFHSLSSSQLPGHAQCCFYALKCSCCPLDHLTPGDLSENVTSLRKSSLALHCLPHRHLRTLDGSHWHAYGCHSHLCDSSNVICLPTHGATGPACCPWPLSIWPLKSVWHIHSSISVLVV